MKLKKVWLHDPLLIGRKVYSRDGVYLGILQFVGPTNKRNGDTKITTRMPGETQEVVFHVVFELFVEVSDVELPEELPDNPKPVSPDTAGYRIVGGTDSYARRKLGEEAGAMWGVRPGVGDEDETDPEDELVFTSEEEAVTSDDRVFDRPAGVVRDPDDPQSDIAVVPRGAPLGRSKGMSLDYVKSVLGAAADACRHVGLQAANVGQQTADVTVRIAGLAADLEAASMHLIQAHRTLSDHRAAVIAATAGHGKPAPAVALGQLDQASKRLEEQRGKIAQTLQALETAQSLLRPAANELDAALTFSVGAAKTFDQYRTSF